MRDLLPELVNGRLDAELQLAVEAHVAECAECAAELTLLRGLRPALMRGPVLDTKRIAAAVRAQMAAAVFPVSFDAFLAQVRFRALNEVERGDGYAMKTCALRHPGGATGYRITDGNAGAPALVYISR